MRKNVFLCVTVLALSLTGCGRGGALKHTGGHIIVKPAADIAEGTFSFKDIKRPKGKLKIEEKKVKLGSSVTSAYAEALNPLHQKVYEELFQTAQKGAENYIVSEKIKPEDFRKIVLILFFDEPTAYALKPSYTYVLDEKGYVKNVSFSYYELLKTEGVRKKFEEYFVKKGEEVDQKIATEAFKKIAKPRKNDNKSVKIFLSEVLRENGTENVKDSELEALSAEYAPVLEKTCFAPFISEHPKEISYAFAMNASLRQNHVPSITVLGERTSKLFLEGEAENYSSLHETEEETPEGVRVTLSTDGLNAWNLVQIDGSWYHSDILMGRKINKMLLSEDTKPYGFGLSDEEASLSKLTYMNENVLGVCPMASDDLASFLRTDDNTLFVDKIPQSRLSDEIAGKIPDFFKKDAFLVSFSDQNLFGSFVLSKDFLFQKYKLQGLLDYKSYETLLIPEILSVYVYKIQK